MQDFAVYLIVLGAAAYLARAWWAASRGQGGCGGCASGCGKKDAAKPAQDGLIQISLGIGKSTRIG